MSGTTGRFTGVRDVLISLLILLTAGLSRAGANIPYDEIKGPICVIQDASGISYPLSPEKTQYNVIITDGFAHIRMTQQFVNTFANVDDIAYVFPLPHEGSVHAMSMEYRDSIYEAKIFEKQRAQQIYDSVVASGGNAALLIQERPNIFQQRLANIAYNDTAYIRIELSMPLKYDNGIFELAVPTMVAPRFMGAVGTDVPTWNPAANIQGQRLQFNVLLHTSYELDSIHSPTHPIQITDLESSRGAMENRGLIDAGTEVPAGFSRCGMLMESNTYPNKDYVLRFKRKNPVRDFSVASFMDSERNVGFFALNLYPDLTSLETTRPDLEVVLLLDISGSQGGWPLQKEKEICNFILPRLHSSDMFTVIAFNNANYWAFGHSNLVPATEDNLLTALNFINSQREGGGTQLLSGIQAALSVPLESDHKRIYVFLTDGFVTNESAIFEELRNHPTKPTVFTFGAGNSLNRYFLDEAANIGNGFSTAITQYDDLDAMVEQAWAKIEGPQMRDISIAFGNAETKGVILPVSTQLFTGSPYQVYGKYAQGGTFTVTLTGYINGAKVTMERDVSFAARSNINRMLPQIWARQKIRQLDIEEGTTSVNKDRIIAISEEYQVLSEYTAFLAINPRAVGEGESYGSGDFFVETDMLDNLRTALQIVVKDGFLWISLPEGQFLKNFQIFDMQGRCVFKWTGGSSTNTDNRFQWDGQRLNASLLKPGRYAIRLSTNGGTITRMVTWPGK